MAVGYRRQAGPAPAEDVERLEQRVGRPLPDSYKDFLRRQDGGQLQDNNEAVNEIFGVGPDVPDWANMWKKLDTYAGRLPTWLLPVASDFAGNLFAVSLRDRDKGSVWFWDHEREADEDEPPADDNIQQRAADWRGFLESLQPPNLDGYDMDDVEIE